MSEVEDLEVVSLDSFEQALNPSSFLANPDIVIINALQSLFDNFKIKDHFVTWSDVDVFNSDTLFKFVQDLISAGESEQDLTIKPDSELQLLNIIRLSFTLEVNYIQLKVLILELTHQISLLSQINTIHIHNAQILPILVEELINHANHNTDNDASITLILNQLTKLCINLLQFGCDSKVLLKLYLNSLENPFFVNFLYEIFNKYPYFVNYFILKDTQLKYENLNFSSSSATIQSWVQVPDLEFDSILFTFYNSKNQQLSLQIKNSRLTLLTNKFIHSFNYTLDPLKFIHLTILFNNSNFYLFVDGEFTEKLNMQNFKFSQCDLIIGDIKNTTELSIKNFLILDTIQSIEWINLSFNLNCNYENFYQNNLLNYLNYKSLKNFELKLEELNQLEKTIANLNSNKFLINLESIVLNLNNNTLREKNSVHVDLVFHDTVSLYKVFHSIGGIPIVMRLIESSQTLELLTLSLKLLFKLLNDWRNIKEIESINGYDILASILKTRKKLINNEILDIILEFVGYDFNNPIDSIIINPLAYRSLIVDFDLWKKSDSDTFKFLLFQFTIFGQDSRFNNFSIKKLIKMRIIKRFIQALKYGSFEYKILPVVFNSLLILVKANPSIEVLRSLSFYIVYGLNNGSSSNLLKKSKSSATLKTIGTPSAMKYSETKNGEVTNLESLQRSCAICVLEVLSTIICDSSTSKLLRKFSKSITIRWILLILNDKSPVVAKLGLRLLIRMFSILGPSVYKNFFSTHGLDMLTYLLRKWWDNDEIIVLIYSAGFGVYQSQNLGSDLSLLSKRLSQRDTKLSILMPEFLLLLNKVVEFSLINLTEAKNDLESTLNCVHLINGFIRSLEIGFEKIAALKEFYSSREWLDGILRITARIEILSHDIFDLRDSGKNFESFISNLIIHKLDSKEFLPAYIPMTNFGSKFLTSALFPRVFLHLNDFLNVSDFQPESKEFFANVSKLLLQYVDYLRFYSSNGNDLNIAINCFILVIESIENKSTAKNYIKQLKKALGSLLVHKFYEMSRDGDSEGYKDITKTLLYRQSVIFQAEVLDNKKIAHLITFILYDISQSTFDHSMSINCLRTIYLHRQGDFAEVGYLFSSDHSNLIPDYFSTLISINDEDAITSVSKNSKFQDTIDINYNKIFNKLDVELQLPSFQQDTVKVMRRETSYNESNINSFKKDRFALKNLIISGELAKYNRHIQDHQDNAQFYISIYNKIKTETSRLLLIDNGPKKFIVDFIEGIDRMRKRIIPENYLTESEKLTYNIDVPMKELLPEADPVTIVAKIDTMSISSSNSLAEIENSFEMIEDPQNAEISHEDKNRKVLRSLNMGDRITDLWNISQINGLAAVESLMILGVTHLYLIENYFHCSNGEVIDIDDAPPELRDPYLQLITGKFPNEVDLSNGVKSHRAKNWDLNKLTSISKRQFLLRDVALEMFFVDGASVLITCLSSKERDIIYNKLFSLTSGKGIDSDLSQTFRLSTSGSSSASNSSFTLKFASAFTSSATNSLAATSKWKTGKISNFYYLMLINTLAGRTFNDLTQYPVFPWIIADYTSEELDLSDPTTFRDLSKPMGAQSETRAQQFKDRYEALNSLQDETAPPFHYGTHYSSAMVTTSFLIRLEPYVQSYLLLQGGKFDHADRLFYSIPKAWTSASRDNTTDVRELIPEFFFLPEFLVNSNNFQFGKLQDGSPISDVKLPPWAKNDPKIFIQKNREALESPYVSANLHKWIDLIFGYKQNGQGAIDSLNVFHHLSYNGAINLDNISDEIERRAMTGIINNFGQTPIQLFSKCHPAREILSSVSTHHSFDTLSIAPTLTFVSKSGLPIARLESGKSKTWEGRPGLISTEDGLTVRPGETTGSLIINKNIYESLHDSEITTLTKIGNKSFITGSADGTLNVWRYPTKSSFKTLAVLSAQNSKSNSMFTDNELEPLSILRGHASRIKSVDISRSFNLCLTLDDDGVILIWDLARFNFIRKLPLLGAIASISDDTGDIIVVSADNEISIFTINGDLILYQKIDSIATISCVTFGSINKPVVDQGSNKHHEYWSNRILVFGIETTLLIYELIVNKHNSWELKKLKVLKSDTYDKITTIKAQLLSEPSGDGKILRGDIEIIFGDASGKVFMWK